MIIRTPTIVRKQIVLLKFNCNSLLKEKFEWVFRSVNQTTDNTTTKRRKGQAVIYKTLHRKLNIEQHKPLKKSVVKLGALEG